ncbi:SH3 domain-containing protein [Devosia neptuniae]|uniref:SH3 domain-containing protein n=1 Tax=Devosia neptuniae TaxID=191302 RepID=A0ABY6C8K9_9HYPH|nr:SH3 domain-containing protein [Devosia neptuniae]UXN68570.1 SH3 domain-containing protein [Devosia neptuniae]
MRALPLAALAALLLVTPALAEPLARVKGGNIDVRTGPGTRYDIIGKLADGAQVPLDECTRDGRWCRVSGSGWVRASYLVGWSAKMRVTQPDFIGGGPWFTFNDSDDEDRGILD